MSIISEAYEEQDHLNPDYPIRCHQDTRAFNFPPHYHRGVEIIYVKEGLMPVDVNGRSYALEAGDLLFIGSHHIHSYMGIEDRHVATYYMLILDWRYFKDLTQNKDHYDYLAPVLLDSHLIRTYDYGSLRDEIESLLTSLIEESTGQDPGNKLMVMSKLYQLLTLGARHLDTHHPSAHDRKQLQKSYDIMKRINRYIYSNYQRPIELEEAATIAGYSTYHFTRVFKALTGSSFKAYLRDFRINMVKDALRSTDLPITDLALSHGFNSLKTFNRNFQEVMGTTPTNYRNSNF